MDCQEIFEGYKVMYIFMVFGNYLISVKYGGFNYIVGSFFKVKVIGQCLVSFGLVNEILFILVELVIRLFIEICYSVIFKVFLDVSKVIFKGVGFLKVFVGQKSFFLVDCSKVGFNMLLIGVYGFIIFCEEVFMKYVGNQ